MPDQVLSALRFTVSATNYAFATTATLRSSLWHEPWIQRSLAMSAPFTDELGIARQGGIEVTLIDPEEVFLGLDAANALDARACQVELVHAYIDDSGVAQEVSQLENMYVASYSMGRHEITLRLEDLEVKQLDQLWPPNLYTTARFPDMLEAHVGRPIPDPVDVCLKLPCALIDTSPSWKYAVCEKPSGGTPTVLTVYRDDRIVTASEYTVGTLTSGGITVVTLTFAREQLDFSGGYFEITADVLGYHSKNAVTEIIRLLTGVGLPYDISAGLSIVANNNRSYVACDHGRDAQRKVSAILIDLLLVARAELYRKSSGDYTIWIDRTGSATATYDEDAGDAIEVSRRDCPGRPESVSLSYRPSPQDPSRLQHTITRAVTGGSQPAATPRALSYVREHETADRLLNYLANRQQYNRAVDCLIARSQFTKGDTISIHSSGLVHPAATYRVWGIRRVPGANELRLLQHDDAIMTYAAASYPADAALGYQPDYSRTPPLAPTALKILSDAVSQSNGTAVSKITVEAVPPVVNAAGVIFLATNSVTGEISLQAGTLQVSGKYQATINGMRPNTLHTLQAWAVSPYNIDGAVVSVFHATAIGGGTADTTFTSKAYGTAPATPSVSSLVHGTGKQISVKWTWSGDPNILKEFEVDRQVGAGAFSNVWKGSGRLYVDDNVSYGTGYTYRVRAVDKYNNTGSYDSASISSGSFVKNVGSSDVMDTNIGTVHRTAVTSISQAYSIPAGPEDWTDTGNFAHGMGVVPLSSIRAEHGAVMTSITQLNTTNCYWKVCYPPYFDSAGIAQSKLGNSGTAVFSFW